MIATGGDGSPVNTLDTRPDTPAPRHHCGSTDVVIARRETGPHFATIRCPECGRTEFAKTPWSLDRARAFTMPRGRKLADPTGTDEGLGYLRWLANEGEGNVSTAARILLDHVTQTSSDGSSSRMKNPVGVPPPTGSSGTNTPFSDSEGVRHE